MSPPEILHRVNEQARRTVSAWARKDWADFGKFDGPLLGLPGCALSRVGTLRAGCEAEATRVRERSFRLLNIDWPRTADWSAVWQLDPVTGAQWPRVGSFAFHSPYRHALDKGDVKYVWEVNRLQFLPALALAQQHELLATILDSWMAANPPFVGINWTSGIEAASRVVSLLTALSMLEADAKKKLDARSRSFLDGHLYWIRRYPSLYSSANNHRVAELAAGFLGAICAPGLPSSSRQLVECRDALEDRMEHLFHGDGVGAEQSVTYAAYALEWLALTGAAADAANLAFGTQYKARAAKAADHLRWLMDDTGRPPAIGDGDETRVLAFRQEPEKRYVASVVALAARWLDAPELSPPAADAHLRDLWGMSDFAPARTPALGMRVFADGGYTVFREGTSCGTLVCIFDHGPLGFESIAAHGHADALSVWLSWGDEPIFVDAGTYLYHSGGMWRDHFRATSVHNTLSIENVSQSRIAGPFNWSRHANARIVERSASSVTAEHDGYYRQFGVIHRRKLTVVSPQLIEIDDCLKGRPHGVDLEWRTGFTLAPGVKLETVDGAAILTTRKRRVLRIEIGLGPPLGNKAQSHYSPSFGQIAKAARIGVSGSVTDDARCVMRLHFEPMI
jgi:hypothetical protein